MINYRIDKTSMTNASSQIKDMSMVLAEIAPTLQVLQNLLEAHEKSISTPSIDDYRARLQMAVSNATVLARNIAEQSQQLCAVGDQAAKHLAAIEEHFGAVLRNDAQAADDMRSTTLAK